VKVLHISPGKMFGGVETALVTFARERRSCADLKPHFAACFEGRFTRELRATGVPVDYLGEVRVRNPFTVLRARAALDRLLAQESIDVVICHMAWAQAIFGPVVRDRRVPLVFWSHGFVTGRHWLERWARLTPPDVVICASAATEQTVRSMYPEAPVARVNYPVTDLSIPVVRDPDAHPTVIIQVSRMEPWKGHELHLRALSQMKHIPDWLCWIVGGAQNEEEIAYEKKLKDLSKNLGLEDRVEFSGSRDDVQELLSQSDIFCQPNTGPEPFGIVFIEALYAGLPVVSTRLGGAAEIINADCGILVDPGDPAAVAGALVRLIKDRDVRRRLAAGAPPRAKTLCDPARQIDSLRHVLQALL
jgi:glycosyltransferase involved in cell wall biosynthesis